MGLGYVGLPTASFLAGKGYRVLGVDVRPEIVGNLNSGLIHIHEPDLAEKLKQGLDAGRFKAALAPAPSDIYIITVPTPVNDDRSPDISYVEKAVVMISESLVPGSLVIIESTSPVGTTELMAHMLRSQRPDLDIPEFTRESGGTPGENRVFVSYCPERILPGHMFKEFVDNDRIIGGIDPESEALAREFYGTFVRGRLHSSDCRTAEMAKLAENTFRDVNIALANELAKICKKLEIDPSEMISLANRHPRVNIHRPGPGVGGHCIPVDPWFIHHAAPDDARIIRAAREINDSMPRSVAAEIHKLCRNIHNPVIAILGLAYKPDIDDLRHSPSVDVIMNLVSADAGRIIVVDPYIHKLPPELAALPGVSLEQDALQAMEKANVVALLVAHWQFTGIAPENLARKNFHIIDATGIWRGLQQKSGNMRNTVE